MCRNQNLISETNERTDKQTNERMSKCMKIEKPGVGRPLFGPATTLKTQETRSERLWGGGNHFRKMFQRNQFFLSGRHPLFVLHLLQIVLHSYLHTRFHPGRRIPYQIEFF